MIKILICLLCVIPMVTYPELKIGIIGDSNSSDNWEYAVNSCELYYRVAERSLQAQEIDVSFYSKSQGGSQTSQGLYQLISLLEENRDISMMVITLGINDALQKIPLQNVYDNLEWMLNECQERGIKVILGIVDVSWYSWNIYGDSFKKVYARLIEKYRVTPFLFIYQGLFQNLHHHIGDYIHPNANGHKIWAIYLERAIKQLLGLEMCLLKTKQFSKRAY